VILEHAVLPVKGGHGKAFEKAILAARPLIAATPGFLDMEVRPCVEVPDRYLLLVWWDKLEAHTHGFRQSANYVKWREALHRFYEPFPIVEHYEKAL